MNKRRRLGVGSVTKFLQVCQCATLALLLASDCWGESWSVEPGGVARAGDVVTSDGAVLSLAVRCDPDPVLTLTHPALAEMPANGEGQLDWYQGAHIHDGWGLDLTRPDHFGHLGIWMRCEHRPDCVHPRTMDVPWIVRQLKTQWTWFIRIQPPGRTVVDAVISLVGSGAAIDAVCPAE